MKVKRLSTEEAKRARPSKRANYYRLAASLPAPVDLRFTGKETIKGRTKGLDKGLIKRLKKKRII